MELKELGQVVKNIETKIDKNITSSEELTKAFNKFKLDTSISIEKLKVKLGLLGALSVSLSIIAVFLSKFTFGK